MRISFLFLVLALHIEAIPIHAQTDSTTARKTNFLFSVYGDLFYAADFNHPPTRYRQSFLYNHNRHGRLSLNQGFAKMAVRNRSFRANLALQAGTYPKDNYVNEPGILKNIFEANAGMALDKKQTWWIDAGIFASHIGFESAISLDNWTLTRSLAAENSPYYLTGVQMTYSPSPKWEMAALVVNGWQHITGNPKGISPALGTRLTFKPSQDMILNWSTFAGSEHPGRIRYFSNLYGQFPLHHRLSLIAGFDLGLEKKAGEGYATWLTPVMVARYSISEKWKSALRAEYYSDRAGVIIPTSTANGFQTTGLSLNLDYFPLPFIACRIEGRWLQSRDRIFNRNLIPVRDNVSIVASVAARWESKKR